jgi:hypothetical protein
MPDAARAPVVIIARLAAIECIGHVQRKKAATFA